MNTNEKVALISGGASGIGLATALALADQSIKVFVADIQEQLGKDVAMKIGGHYLHLDVSKERDWSTALEEVSEKAGRLDILVNNAGIGSGGDLETTSLNDFNKTLAVNLTGVFLGCKAAMPLLEKSGGGSIVNVSSIFGMVGDQLTIAYSASKGGVRAMTKSIALDCAARENGVRVNSVHPGFVATPLVEGAIRSMPKDMADEYGLRTVGQTPLKRFGNVDEISDVIVFLTSSASRFMTGSEVIVDGGYTAR